MSGTDAGAQRSYFPLSFTQEGLRGCESCGSPPQNNSEPENERAASNRRFLSNRVSVAEWGRKGAKTG